MLKGIRLKVVGIKKIECLIFSSNAADAVNEIPVEAICLEIFIMFS